MPQYVWVSFETIFRGLVNSASLMLIKRSNLIQQYADIYLLQSHSTCFGRHSTHHQEHFAKLLRWDLLIYILYKIIQFVVVCQFIPSVCVLGAPYWMKMCHIPCTWYTYGQNESTYEHKPNNFITNVNQQTPS